MEGGAYLEWTHEGSTHGEIAITCTGYANLSQERLVHFAEVQWIRLEDENRLEWPFLSKQRKWEMVCARVMQELMKWNDYSQLPVAVVQVVMSRIMDLLEAEKEI